MTGLKAVDGDDIRPRKQAPWAMRAMHTRIVVRLLTVLLLCTGVRASGAEDGTALLHKMMDAYQHLTSYEFHSNVDFMVVANGRTIQSQSSSNIVQYKHPNKVQLVVYNTGPTGTRSIYSDGTTLTIYDAVPKHYFFGATAPNMNGILKLLSTRAHVVADLDPLYFLCTNKLPATLRDVKTGNSTTVNGRPSFVVTGTVGSGQAPVQKDNAITTKTMRWTWYIDQQTYLLNKVEAHSDPINATFTPRDKSNKGPTKVNVVMNLRHNVSISTVNSPIDDSVFVFHAPAGSTGQNLDSLKGAK